MMRKPWNAIEAEYDREKIRFDVGQKKLIAKKVLIAQNIHNLILDVIQQAECEITAKDVQSRLLSHENGLYLGPVAILKQPVIRQGIARYYLHD
jgi:hypothetical protein